MSDYQRWLEEMQQADPYPQLRAECADIKKTLDQKIESATVEANTAPVSNSSHDKKVSPRAFAVAWLRALLEEPRWAEDVLSLAAAQGISHTTLKRAKKSIGVRSEKMGGYFGGEDTRWVWRLG